MIPTIIIIALAFTWLLYETDFLRIRLETTAYQKAAKTEVNHYTETDTDTEAETKIPYKPSEFIPSEIPEFTGKLNIVCQIE